MIIGFLLNRILDVATAIATSIATYMIIQEILPRRRVAKSLYFAYDCNKTEFKRFYKIVDDSSNDRDAIEKYHKFATTNVKFYRLEQNVLLRRRYFQSIDTINRHFDDVLRLQKEIEETFKKPENEQLWQEFCGWKKDMSSNDLQRCQQANNNMRNITSRTWEYCLMMSAKWNEFAGLYQKIVNENLLTKR
jgi:hypothetical protein